MPRLLLLPLLIASFALAACGDDEDTSTTTTPPAAGGTTESTPADEEATAGGVTIQMKDNTFAPGQASVKVGDTVTFSNAGAVAHNAVGEGLESGTVDPGGTFEFTAEKAGQIAYVCTFHSGMEGTLTVE